MSYLEIQVAMVVLGIGLAGICPLVVMQLKLLRKLESPAASSATPQLIRGVRILDGAAYVIEGDPVGVLRPHPDAWVRRFGLPASIAAAVATQTYSATPSRQVVAVGDAGFSAEGWIVEPDADATGNGIARRATDSAVTGPASWDFTGIFPGYYRVVATWTVDSMNATDAAYQLTGAGGSSSASMDQTAAAPSAGLGVFYLDQSLHVELAVSETGRVVADAIRIIPLNRVRVVAPVAASSNGFSITVGVVLQ